MIAAPYVLAGLAGTIGAGEAYGVIAQVAGDDVGLGTIVDGGVSLAAIAVVAYIIRLIGSGTWVHRDVAETEKNLTAALEANTQALREMATITQAYRSLMFTDHRPDPD